MPLQHLDVGSLTVTRIAAGQTQSLFCNAAARERRNIVNKLAQIRANRYFEVERAALLAELDRARTPADRAKLLRDWRRKLAQYAEP